jgi:hypothetical protein
VGVTPVDVVEDGVARFPRGGSLSRLGPEDEPPNRCRTWFWCVVGWRPPATARPRGRGSNVVSILIASLPAPLGRAKIRRGDVEGDVVDRLTSPKVLVRWRTSIVGGHGGSISLNRSVSSNWADGTAEGRRPAREAAGGFVTGSAPRRAGTGDCERCPTARRRNARRARLLDELDLAKIAVGPVVRPRGKLSARWSARPPTAPGSRCPILENIDGDTSAGVLRRPRGGTPGALFTVGADQAVAGCRRWWQPLNLPELQGPARGPR